MEYVGYDLNNDNLNDTVFRSTLYGGTLTPDKIYLSFHDLTLKKNEELYFTLLPNSLTQATWTLRDTRGLYNGPNGTIAKITLPKNIILTKQ